MIRRTVDPSRRPVNGVSYKKFTLCKNTLPIDVQDGHAIVAAMSNPIIDSQRLVQRVIKNGRVTKTKLAEEAGVPLTTLIGMEREDWNPRRSTLAALTEAVYRLRLDRVRPKLRAAYQPAV